MSRPLKAATCLRITALAPGITSTLSGSRDPCKQDPELVQVTFRASDHRVADPGRPLRIVRMVRFILEQQSFGLGSRARREVARDGSLVAPLALTSDQSVVVLLR